MELGGAVVSAEDEFLQIREKWFFWHALFCACMNKNCVVTYISRCVFNQGFINRWDTTNSHSCYWDASDLVKGIDLAAQARVSPTSLESNNSRLEPRENMTGKIIWRRHAFFLHCRTVDTSGIQSTFSGSSPRVCEISRQNQSLRPIYSVSP